MNPTLQLWLGAILVVGAVAALFYKLVSKRETLAEIDTKRMESKSVHGDLADLLNQTSDSSERETLMTRFRGALNETTSKTIDDHESGKRLRRLLEQGDSKLRPGEFVFMAFGAAMVGFFAATVIRGPIIGIVAFLLVLFGSYIRLVRAVAKRRDAFAGQLSDVLQMLSVSLRSGLSLQQSVQMVAAEAPSPTGEEFRRVVAEQRVGRDMTDSFTAMAHRMDCKDFEWVTSAIDINRTVGGDLSQILSRVERTIRARNKVRGQVKAMSAEGKMSGLVLVALPPGMLFMISLVNPEFMAPLFEETIGWILLAVASAMLAAGWAWLSKLASFEY